MSGAKQIEIVWATTSARLGMPPQSTRIRATAQPDRDWWPTAIATRRTPSTPLNYAYAALQSQLQIQAIAEGYDPNLGIMHVDREYGPAFVFDLMEPERPKVDRAIIEFLKSETLHPADFVIRTDGVVRLNPQLARHVAALVANDTR
jgi:CRISPR associated protein Cas1